MRVLTSVTLIELKMTWSLASALLLFIYSEFKVQEDTFWLLLPMGCCSSHCRMPGVFLTMRYWTTRLGIFRQLGIDTVREWATPAPGFWDDETAGSCHQDTGDQDTEAEGSETLSLSNPAPASDFSMQVSYNKSIWERKPCLWWCLPDQHLMCWSVCCDCSFPRDRRKLCYLITGKSLFFWNYFL
jgi:hypothetical protein